MLAVHVRQQAPQREVNIAFARPGFQTVVRGHNAVAQTINHVFEHVGGNDAIAHQVLLTRYPHGCHVFASLRWHAAIGCS